MDLSTESPLKDSASDEQPGTDQFAADDVPASLTAAESNGNDEPGAGGSLPFGAPSASAAPSQGSSAGVALAIFALALLGQFYFKNLRYVLDGLVFFGAAIVVLLIAAAGREAGGTEGGPSWTQGLIGLVRRQRMRAGLVVLSVLLSFTVWRSLRAMTGAVSYRSIFVVWVASLACYLFAFVHIIRPDLRAWWRKYRYEVLVVALMTAAALFVRLVALGKAPNIVSGDEGRVGLLGLSALHGEINNMFATLFGHSTLYLFIIGYFMKMVGLNAAGLRITSALAGALTVPALYVLARHMFNVRVGLIAAALVLVSHFHVHFSRIIVAGGIQDALFATVAFYLLLTGLERRSTARLVLSGLVMGVHLYIYMGARLVILFLPVYLLALLITNPKLVRENLGGLIGLVGMLLITSVPIGLWAIQHPADFSARINQIGVIQSGWLANEAAKLGQSKLHILANLLLQAFLSVNFYPATAFYNSPLPMLDFLSGAMFMLGIGYSLFHITDRRHLLLQGWFWSGVVVGGALVVLPGISAYRILIVFPAVCIFVALGCDTLLNLAFGRSVEGELVRNGVAAAFVVLIAVANLRAYFVDYAPSCRYEDWWTRFASYMGEERGKVGPAYQAFLFGYPDIWYGIHPSVDFLSGQLPIADVKEPLTGGMRPTFVTPGTKAIFFFTSQRKSELDLLRQYVPGGKERTISDCGVPMLTIYQVDGPDDGAGAGPYDDGGAG